MANTMVIMFLFIHRFIAFDPARFRIGDIIELQMNVVAVPVKGGRFKMITQLRTLAKLNNYFSQVRAQQMNSKRCS